MNYDNIKELLDCINYPESILYEEDIYKKNDIYMRKIFELITMYNNICLSLERIKEYEELVKYISYITKEIGYDSLSYAIVLDKLIYEGKLSISRKFKKTIKTKYFIDDVCNLGADIFNGYGCCRHIASLIDDVFKYINNDQFLYPVSVSNSIEPNHVANLIKYENKYYIYDATIHSIIPVHHEFKNGNFKNSYDFKPAGLFLNLCTSHTYDDVLNLVFDIGTTLDNATISEDKEYELKNDVEYLYNKNKKLIKQFTHDCKPLKKEIIKKLNK